MENKLFLFRISQSVNDGWDVYLGAVVVSDTKENAKRIHPDGKKRVYTRKEIEERRTDTGEAIESWHWETWVALEDVKCKRIGIADDGIKEGKIILSSFRAG
jgi:hypothetical protein